MVIQQTEKPVKWGVRSDKNPKPVTCKSGDLQGVLWGILINNRTEKHEKRMRRATRHRLKPAERPKTNHTHHHDNTTTYRRKRVVQRTNLRSRNIGAVLNWFAGLLDTAAAADGSGTAPGQRSGRASSSGRRFLNGGRCHHNLWSGTALTDAPTKWRRLVVRRRRRLTECE